MTQVDPKQVAILYQQECCLYNKDSCVDSFIVVLVSQVKQLDAL